MGKTAELEYSKSKINKSGILLRDYVNGSKPNPGAAELDEALDVIQSFRNAHGYPMTKVRLGLTSMVNTLELDAAITQRHKRVPRIVRKLVRMEHTMLARLEDIGGCRIVVDTALDMDRICKRIHKNWQNAYCRPPRDYVAEPKDIGYRAIHYVVRRDGRAVEVQIRTRGQQQWADAVEAIDARKKLMLKDGVGPEELLRYFSLAGQMIHHAEYGGSLDDVVRAEFEQARQDVIDAGHYDS